MYLKVRKIYSKNVSIYVFLHKYNFQMFLSNVSKAIVALICICLSILTVVALTSHSGGTNEC